MLLFLNESTVINKIMAMLPWTSSMKCGIVTVKLRRILKTRYSCWGLESGQSILGPYQADLGDRSAKHLPLAVGWIIRLGYDSSMGQWQVSIASTPPQSTLTLCSSRSKGLAAFFCLFLPPVKEDRRGGGPPRHRAQLECTNPEEGGWKKNTRRGLQTTVGLKAVSGENAQGDTEIWSPTVWGASLPSPWTLSWTHLIFPTMKSDLAEHRAQVNGQEQSNCLSPRYAPANHCKEVCSGVCFFESVFESLFVYALSVCKRMCMLMR